MNQSVNELSALTKLAARGAAYPWGMAEEASFSLRWLLDRQLLAVDALACVLKLYDKLGRDGRTPSVQGSKWSAPESALCPLCTGVALNDYAEVLVQNREIELGKVVCPVLLLPFAAQASRVLNETIVLSWGDATVMMAHGQLYVDNNNRVTIENKTWQLGEARVSCAFVESPNTASLQNDGLRQLEPCTTRPAIDTDCLMQLKELAHRTYAPATEASRKLGAGAGETDND